MADGKTAFLLVVLLGNVFSVGEAQTCEGSKAAYEASGFSVEDVPDQPVQGTFNQLCDQTLETCCTSTMESRFENITLNIITPLIPPLNLLTSKVVDIVTPAEDHIIGNLSAAVDYWNTSVATLDTATESAFQSLQADLKAIVDFGTVGQVETSLPRLLTVLRLSLVTTSQASYTEEFLACAQSNLTSSGYIPDSTQLVTRFTAVLMARFHTREIVTLLQILFNSLEVVGLPIHECVRSYAQLFYCHICTHTVAGASPCEAVCENVMAGCAGHLHLLGTVVDASEDVAASLYNAGNSNSLWDFRQIVTRMRDLIVQVQSATSAELSRMVDELNQCPSPPTLVKPTSDIPQPVTAGTLDSTVLPSLYNHMYEPIFQGLKASVLDKFEDISETFVSQHCSGAVDSGACWARTELVLRTVQTDVVEFGADALDNNPDIMVNGLDTDIRSLRGTFIQQLDPLNAQLNSTASFVAALPDELTQPQPSAVFITRPLCSLVLVSVVIAIIMLMK